jgi:rhodanese-related sulfurtransferase
MIVVVGLALLVFVGALLLQNAGNSTSANNPNTTAQGSTGGNVTPDMTATMVAFSTITAPDILPRMTVQEAKALYDAGNIKLIDVRTKELYDQGHIKGAVNVPQNEVGTHIKDLPRDGNLVLYCDCPHDEESAGTAYSLKTAGYTNMHVLEGPQAYSEWKNAGFPVEP